MPTFTLQGEHITLAHALKASGLAESGGHAKVLVRLGQVLVNGQTEQRPGRKLFAGDRFQLEAHPEWTVTREE
jgi:ribosome-associated protein